MHCRGSPQQGAISPPPSLVDALFSAIKTTTRVSTPCQCRPFHVHTHIAQALGWDNGVRGVFRWLMARMTATGCVLVFLPLSRSNCGIITSKLNRLVEVLICPHTWPENRKSQRHTACSRLLAICGESRTVCSTPVCLPVSFPCEEWRKSREAIPPIGSRFLESAPASFPHTASR